MNNAEIIKSNKRWFIGISLVSGIVGAILLGLSLDHPTYPQILFLAAISLFISGLYAGTYLMYHAHNQ